ncbi:MAG: type II toxin-antitoxin system HicA family toxin [Methanothrix sp.]|nr:type II toxin-antitoxin system HicA family toxin [Methanothrix sp.]
MRKLPVVSGEKLIKVLVSLEYEIIRQRGSHVRLKNPTEAGEHNIMFPCMRSWQRAHSMIFISGIHLEWDFQR